MGSNLGACLSFRLLVFQKRFEVDGAQPAKSPNWYLVLIWMCVSSSCSAKPMMRDVSLIRMIPSTRGVRCVGSLLHTSGSQLPVVSTYLTYLYIVVSTPLMCSGMRSYYLNSASALAHSIASSIRDDASGSS